MLPRVCVDYSSPVICWGQTGVFRRIAWINSYGRHHLFDMRIDAMLPWCYSQRRCLVCERWIDCVEEDADERLAQHDWREWDEVQAELRKIGKQLVVQSGELKPHFLFCMLCYTLWDPCADAKKVKI